jgi:seryl-tRNA synthetase
VPDILVRLPKPVDAAFGPDIARRIFFVDSQIVDFELIYDDAQIVAVRLDTEVLLNTDSMVPGQLTSMIVDDIVKQGLVRQKVTWSTNGTGPIRDVFDDLIERDQAVSLGRGQVAVGEPLLSLMDYIDGLLRELVRTRLGGVEYRYPTVIPTSTLQRCGYFESFPQFLMFVTRLHSDVDTYHRFVRDYGASGRALDPAVLGACDDVELCLPPTMCFHTFSQFAGAQLASGENRVVTSRGKSFRFESRYATTLERLWDFTIREIVFLGSREFVFASRQLVIDAVRELVTTLGLAATCEVANDPFFTEDTATKIVSQRLLELKYELRLELSNGRSLAAGSFNFHDDFFSKRFDIRSGPDDLARSGCVGIGLERFVYAFVCQHGIDPARWPLPVRDAFVAVPLPPILPRRPNRPTPTLKERP